VAARCTITDMVDRLRWLLLLLTTSWKHFEPHFTAKPHIATKNFRQVKTKPRQHQALNIKVPASLKHLISCIPKVKRKVSDRTAASFGCCWVISRWKTHGSRLTSLSISPCVLL
jgi:hypothetical protein